MGRTLAACGLPALAIVIAWLQLEQPRRGGETLAVALLALVPALFPRWWQRAVALATVAGAAVWLVSGVRPWRLLPLGDDGAEPLVRSVSHGVGDFYGVVLPFDPEQHLEMHMLVLAAVFGFVAATALLVAARLPLPAAGVTLAGACWPATLADAGAVGTGALALAAALSIFLALRVRSVRALAVGAASSALVIAGAAWASNATAIAQSSMLNWEAWDFRGLPAKALGVRFVWDANYDGVAFPSTQTVVLEVSGPTRAQYWRVSTLDLFPTDRWIEDLYPQLIGPPEGDVPLDSLAPARARDREGWLEQRIEVRALVDDRLAAAGTPVALQARSIGTAFFLDGGVIRARRSLEAGTRYRVWSYVPDPSPATLAAAPARYPRAATKHLTLWGRLMPAFGVPGREDRVEQVLAEKRFVQLGSYRPLWDAARRVAGDAETPYAAVLALEEWFRSAGDFRYEEQPPRASPVVPPLVHFVTASKAGYCQHFAGAMAVMLRLLGVPSRVAVGFTSGILQDGRWKVTDHNAHAWVEVWFPGQGWVSFDPTPGRGTFAGNYSFASESAQAVDALSRGVLGDAGGAFGRGFTEREALLRPAEQSSRPSLLTVALVVVLGGAAAIGAAKWLVRRARYLTADPRRLSAASRLELEAFLRDQGVDLPASATLDDVRRAVRDEVGVDASAFVEAASRGRFGRPHGSGRSAQAARRELRALLKGIRAELSPWMRLRGFVSLRSLRGGWQA